MPSRIDKREFFATLLCPQSTAATGGIRLPNVFGGSVIADFTRGNILTTNHRNVVFAVNTEGENEAGFAGLVAHRYWSELASTGRSQLGTVMSRTVGDRTFHAVVCHSQRSGGWAETPWIVECALNDLVIPSSETIGIVLIGGGPVGSEGGADIFAILGGIARSNKLCWVYSL